jgi:aldehyde dehydrogenase (NAD+)
MAERFKNLIDGKWVDSANGVTFDDINPANKTDVLGSFPRSDHRDIDRAVESARSFFPIWSRVPPIRRSEILHDAARFLDRHAEEVSALIVRESGKVVAEAQREVQDAGTMLHAIAGETIRSGGTIVPAERPEVYTLALPVPLGVSATVTSWTFPLAGCLWEVASSLAAGNTVVLKPAEDTPLVAARVVEILLEAGLPPESIGLVHGHAEEAGAPLVRHPDAAVVSFVGSPDVGREVAIACAAEQKRLLLDLGERSVALVLEDADLELAAESTIRAGLAIAGQRWLGSMQVLVHRKVLREFGERLVARVQALRLGDGASAATDIGPIINEAQLKRVHGHTRMGLRDGARLLCGGEVVKDADCKRGFFYAPTVFGDATSKMRVVQEEVSGPTLVLFTVGSVEDAIEWVQAVRHDVTASVYTRDLTRGLRVIAGLCAGRMFLNPTPIDPGGASPLAGFGSHSRFRPRALAQRLEDLGRWNVATIDSVGKRP